MDSPKFIEDSILDVLVPQDSDYDVEKLLEYADTGEHAEPGLCRLFPLIATRNMLHFGKSKLAKHVVPPSYSFIGT